MLSCLSLDDNSAGRGDQGVVHLLPTAQQPPCSMSSGAPRDLRPLLAGLASSERVLLGRGCERQLAQLRRKNRRKLLSRLSVACVLQQRQGLSTGLASSLSCSVGCLCVRAVHSSIAALLWPAHAACCLAFWNEGLLQRAVQGGPRMVFLWARAFGGGVKALFSAWLTLVSL